ncbi:MAG: DUF2946 family protein [Rhodospirillaceae bacterium]
MITLLRTPALAVMVMAAVLGLLVAPVAGVVATALGTGALITICSERGVSQIIFDAGNPAADPASPAPAKAHQRQLCPFCLSQAGAPVLPGQAFTPPLMFGPAPPAPAASVAATPCRLFLTGHPSRAPPAVSV